MAELWVSSGESITDQHPIVFVGLCKIQGHVCQDAALPKADETVECLCRGPLRPALRNSRS